MSGNLKELPAGVLSGDQVQEVFASAQDNLFALPAANVVGTNSINAVLESAVEVNSPVMIQFSSGGSVFFAGKGLDNQNQRAASTMTVVRIASMVFVPIRFLKDRVNFIVIENLMQIEQLYKIQLLIVPGHI